MCFFIGVCCALLNVDVAAPFSLQFCLVFFFIGLKREHKNEKKKNGQKKRQKPHFFFFEQNFSKKKDKTRPLVQISRIQKKEEYIPSPYHLTLFSHLFPAATLRSSISHHLVRVKPLAQNEWARGSRWSPSAAVPSFQQVSPSRLYQ